ncbi:cysteine desulfurase family protein [Bacillus sp. FJAT-50079]|uniref:cysteine desulfurase family protein n=1 Tax=Bacillus sp. FJAT-50079 TaxID=2833577 RepID=UPI001BC9C176|nr:cysteine desulfurase family protein [Bacillus sp. FJAT-50079]MBS4208746.1 cysteine desulfurase [Bacillus sp. FJAT-50079]
MIYFDNSATTKPYDDVLDTYVKVNRQFFGNPSSLHNFGGKSEQLLTRAREQIANLCNAKPAEIYFTSGGTEANNMAIKGAAMMHKGRGNHIISTVIEHPSVIESLEQLREQGFEVTYVPVDQQGRVSVADIEAALTDQTILVSVMHVNNEIGSVQPIQTIGNMLKQYSKVLFHVDHVQGAGKINLDFQEAAIDLCSVSAHKFHGLKGTGFLYIREGVKINPLLGGGNQEGKMRSGTENVAGIVAMARALRLTEEKRVHEMDNLELIRNCLYDELKQNQEIIVHTPMDAAPHIINFSVQRIKGEVLVHALEEEGIIISTTSACSSKDQRPSKTLTAIGVSDQIAESAVRISLSYENTLEEAKQFIERLDQVLQRLNHVMRRK